MKRSLYLGVAMASVMGLSACSLETEETGDGSEQVGGVEQALEFDSRDALLAALGGLTLECLGTVDPSRYAVNKDGTLARKFKGCINKDGDATLKQIDSLLGVQFSQVGKKDQLGEYYSKTWSKYVSSFPKYIEQCPTYKRTKTINPPTFENVKKHLESKEEYAKENYEYYVESKQCGKDTECTVKHALVCAGGFGSQFLISGNPKDSSILVDPLWWTTSYQYPTPDTNPFMTPGYYHGMSFYGNKPGSLYGAIQREGELCSKWSEAAGKHYTDRKLVGIDCGGGWYCMSYCM